MIAAKTKYFKIKNPETGEFDSFIFIKGDHGYLIGPDQIVSDLGESEELVISQKFYTEKYEEITSMLGMMNTILFSTPDVYEYVDVLYDGVYIVDKINDLIERVNTLESKLT